MLWWVGSGMLAIWFILTFILHQRGMIHVLLLSGISVLVVQFAASCKTRYQKRISRK
jgi:hypothetical protein